VFFSKNSASSLIELVGEQGARHAKSREATRFCAARRDEGISEAKAVVMSDAEEWRRHVTELREVAEQEADPARRTRLWQLADRWDRFAAELAETESETAPCSANSVRADTSSS
jgi:hypothetical protein